MRHPDSIQYSPILTSQNIVELPILRNKPELYSYTAQHNSHNECTDVCGKQQQKEVRCLFDCESEGHVKQLGRGVWVYLIGANSMGLALKKPWAHAWVHFSFPYAQMGLQTVVSPNFSALKVVAMWMCGYWLRAISLLICGCHTPQQYYIESTFSGAYQ